MPLEVSVAAARQKLTNQPKTVLLDVREPAEYDLAHLPESLLIPMNLVPGELQKLESLADEAEILVLCHHGVRSLQVAAWLQSKGIDNVSSINGGIDRWSVEVDPAIPRY